MTIIKCANSPEWLALRKPNVNSTEIAAMFGLSERKSRLKLWHIKKGNVEDDIDEENPFLKWGKRLQNVVGYGICEDEGLECHDLTGYYMLDEELRLGASMDHKVICPIRGAGLLEIKVVERASEENGWGKNNAPIEYECQIQGQLHLADRNDQEIKWGALGGLIQRQNSFFWPRQYDRDFGALIDKEAKLFKDSLDANEPPDPNYYLDKDLLHKLRGPLKSGDQIILTGNARAEKLIEEIKELKDQRAPLKEQADKIKTEIAAREAEFHNIMGKNEIAIVGRYRIKAAVQVRQESVNYGGTSHRRFDLSQPKGNKRYV